MKIRTDWVDHILGLLCAAFVILCIFVVIGMDGNAFAHRKAIIEIEKCEAQELRAVLIREEIKCLK